MIRLGQCEGKGMEWNGMEWMGWEGERDKTVEAEHLNGTKLCTVVH